LITHHFFVESMIQSQSHAVYDLHSSEKMAGSGFDCQEAHQANVTSTFGWRQLGSGQCNFVNVPALFLTACKLSVLKRACNNVLPLSSTSPNSNRL
jgi:hypothetical protein